jgi:2-oxoisovalerate dehydrogenase E2 component (dihydrolipoyl transacylase)
MTSRAIKVPDIGEGIAEVELVAWHVKPGDRVVEDQVIAEVMTDKAAVEIPSPLAGSVVALGGEVGQMLAVGSELIRIDVAGTGDARPAAPAASQAAATPDEPAAAAAPAVAAPRPKPVALAPAPRAPAAARPKTGIATDRPIASPSVRRRAWELGVDLNTVAPTGPAGRVTQADVEAHAAASPAAPAGAAAATAAAPTNSYAERNDEEAIQVIGVRRRIAIKMQESKRRIPHFAYVEEIDVTEVEALRAQLNAKWAEQRPRLTLLPLLARAIVLAVREHPVVNAASTTRPVSSPVSAPCISASRRRAPAG